jgi:hypothetical protein
MRCAAEVIAHPHPHPPPPKVDLPIISSFPAILADFGGKRFSLLWRGDRDDLGG